MGPAEDPRHNETNTESNVNRRVRRVRARDFHRAVAWQCIFPLRNPDFYQFRNSDEKIDRSGTHTLDIGSNHIAFAHVTRAQSKRNLIIFV